MKKFFKFGSSKKNPANVQGPTSPHRRSLVSIGSSVSGSESVGWGSFSSNVDAIKGYQIDPSKDKSLTKLHKACWTGDLGSVKKYIKKIDINQVDSESRTPLHLAATQAHKDVIWFLLGSKAKPNLPDIDGNTPLLKAVQCGHADIVQFLLERGADPKACDVNGNTGLHHVVCDGQQDLAVSLIQKGANIDAKNKDGATPLMLSTIHRQLEMTELLLRHGASVNLSDKKHKTCLMFACEKGYSEFVEIFMQHGIDENAANNAGDTAEDIAKFAGHDECVNTLNNYRLRKSSSQKNRQEHQMNNIILPTERPNDINPESNEHSRASQADLNADFSGSDLDSWNDDASEASIHKDHGVGVDLSKFLVCNTDLSHSETSDINWEDKRPESPKFSKSVNAVKSDQNEIGNEYEVNQRTSALEVTVSDVPLVSDNGSGSLLQKSATCFENVSDSEQRKDRDFLAELGLSDVSEVSTPTISGFSAKDEARKDTDTDVEEDEIRHDNPNTLAVDVVHKEMSREAPLLKACIDENIDPKAVGSSSLENKSLPNNEPNTFLTCASQNMGSLQTVYVSVNKVGSFNDGSGSDTDWDNDSEDNNTDGHIHIHPIRLQTMPNDEAHSSKMLQNYCQDDQIKTKNINAGQFLGHTLPHPVTVASMEPLTKEQPSNVISSEGTLGRPGTMHEVEELWVKNPSVEIVKEAAQSTAMSETQSSVKEEALFLGTDEAQSLAKKNFSEDVDNIYYAELALVNSQDTSRSNTLDGYQKERFNQIVHVNDAEIKNSETLSMEQLWAHIWLQMCGKPEKENDTESSDEISSVAITDQENKDSSFSSADVDQSVASAQDDVLPYHLLTSFLRDPNCSRRVIELVQHLRLSWQKEQDKSKLLLQKIKLLKLEAQQTAEKSKSLNASKVDAENSIHRLEAELEAAKHALQCQENVCDNVELELNQRKTQLLVMEDKLLKEISARQHAELFAKANQEEAKTTQDLVIQLSTQIHNKMALLADFCCQTDQSHLVDSQMPAVELDLLTKEKVKLQCETSCLKQQIDSLALSLSQKNKQQSELEGQLETLQKELIVKDKDLTQLYQNLTETKRECSIKVITENMLNKRIEELQEEYLILSSKIGTTEEKKGQLSKDLAVASNDLKECNLKISLQEKEIQTRKTQEETLQISLKAQINENEQQKQELTDIQKRLTCLQSDYAKVQFELDNGSKLQQLVLDQEETQKQISKAKEEKYIALVKENDELKLKIEEFIEQDLLNVQKVNVLTEKLLNANSMKAEVADLHSQLAIVNNKLSYAQVKIGELKVQLKEEQTANLRFLTTEKELEETSKKLNHANDTIATIEKLLTVAQENERNNENQLQNELQSAKLQLQDAESIIKQLHIEVNEKEKMIQDFTVRLEHHTKVIDHQKQTSSLLVQHRNEKQYFDKNCLNVEGGNVVLDHSLQGTTMESAINWLEDVDEKGNHGYEEIHDGILPTLNFSKYDETLEHLQEQVDEVRKQSVEGKAVSCHDQNAPSSSGGQQQDPGLAAQSLNYQINFLGKKLQEERQQKEAYQAQLNVHKQQLLKANGLLRHALHVQNVQNGSKWFKMDDSANTLKNSVADVDMEFMRHSWEIGARRDLNQQLDKINKFLEDRSLANEHLEQLHKEREIRLHRDYQRAVRDLRHEVRQLHEELQEKESNRKALEEQNLHRRKLNEARKRVKAKLRDHTKEKTKAIGKHLHTDLQSSTPEYAMTSLTTLHGMSGSPIINNLKSFKDLESALSAKLGFDQDKFTAPQLSDSAAFDSQLKSNIHLSLDKTTSEYLDALKKNFLL